jgi:hypothetical protein
MRMVVSICQATGPHFPDVRLHCERLDNVQFKINNKYFENVTKYRPVIGVSAVSNRSCTRVRLRRIERSFCHVRRYL